MSEDIVISGISGRFVESDNTEELWNNLVTNRDMINDDERRFPKGLFGMPHRSGGKLKSLDKFDAEFFGISENHANISDPLIRIFHEVVFETLIDSGNDPAKLSGKKIGVFVANDWLDRHQILLKNEKSHTIHSVNGTYPPLLANNISYFFNFKGPSFALSSGCNAAVYALNMAMMSIRSGQCDSVIVAGCNLCLNPLITLSSISRGFISLQGMSKFMDERADGFVRSEICCAIHIERAQYAKRIYSRVLATGLSHDGYKEKRYVPSSDAIRDLINETIDKANIDKNSVRYVECHGAGTQLGDQAEVTGIYNALCTDRQRTDPVWLGSVKTNMGHAEVGAFMSSLTKVLLCFEHGTIPASLHLDKLAPRFKAMKPNLRHIGHNMAYEQGPYMITSLGLGGSTAVVLLGPYETGFIKKPSNIEFPAIIPVFSRTEDGIRQAIDKINEYSINGRVTPDFIMMIYSIANLENMPYRGYMISNSLTNDGTHSFKSHYSTKQRKNQIIFRFGDINHMNENINKNTMKIKAFKEVYENANKYYRNENIKLESLEENARNFLNNVMTVMSMVNMLLSLSVLPDQCIANSLFGQLLCAYVNRDLNDEHILQIAYQLSKSNTQNITDQRILDLIKANYSEYLYELIKAYHSDQDTLTKTMNKSKNSIIIDFLSIDSKTDINRDITDDCIRLNIFSESDFHTNVLTLLGRLYEWGLDIEWNALYASSGQYPVSRGTQSVVPLLQWDHSKDYFVPKYTDFI